VVKFVRACTASSWFRSNLINSRPIRQDRPFANLPEKKRTQWALTKEEMKNCKWVKPEVVAQIEFAEWTPDAHLRHSTFVGLRDDKDPREVVREAKR
jgi:ATP-dependent DNA ligase